MKTRILSLLSIILGLGLFQTIQATETYGCRNEEWKQKMMSEKIAFLTGEMNITPEEAQVFWPVYNQIWQEKDKAMMNIFKTHKNLEDGIKAGKGEKEIEILLDEYLKAKKRQRDIDSEAAERIKEVLPIEKVAKLYIGEEKFRRQQIHKLHERREAKTEK